MAKAKQRQVSQGTKEWKFIANEQKSGWALIASLFFVFTFVSFGMRWAIEEVARRGIIFSTNPDINMWAQEVIILLVTIWLSVVWLRFAKKFAIKEQRIRAFDNEFEVTIGDETNRYSFEDLVDVELKERNDRYASFTIQMKDKKIVWKARREGNLFGSSMNADYTAIRNAHKFFMNKIKAK